MVTTAATAKSVSGSFTVTDVAEHAVMFVLVDRLNSTTVPFVPQTIELPFTVKGKFVVPVVVVVGLIVVITGIGFMTVNGTAFVALGVCVESMTVTDAAAPLSN